MKYATLISLAVALGGPAAAMPAADFSRQPYGAASFGRGPFGSGTFTPVQSVHSASATPALSNDGTPSLGTAQPVIRAPRVIPAAWQQMGKASTAAPVHFTMPLKGANFDELEAKMLSIASSKGAWLTREQLSYYTAPSAQDIANIKLFLSNAGIPDSAVAFGPNSESVSVETDVATAQALFGNAQLYDFSFQGQTYKRAKTLSIPQSLAHVVMDVQPLTAFPDVHAGPIKQMPLEKPAPAAETATTRPPPPQLPSGYPRSGHYEPVSSKSNVYTPVPYTPTNAPPASSASATSAAPVNTTSSSSTPISTTATSSSAQPMTTASSGTEPSSCSAEPYIYPACLRDLIGSTSYTPQPVSGQLDVTIMGYLGQYVSQTDLTQFLQYFRPDAYEAGYQLPIINAAGAPNNGSDPGIEAMLDVEYVVSQNYPLSNQFLNWNDGSGDIFEAGLNYIYTNYTALPGVVSTSYGAAELGLSANTAQAFCATAQKLTALGTTIVFASGDNGVDTVQATNAPSCATGFNPTYPSGCPYVLSIGGTQDFTPEVAVDPSNQGGFYSGGGFSTFFDRPSYQDSAVSSYLNALGSNSSGLYNTNGRGFPDVSTQAAIYAIEQAGNLIGVSGTSCAAPTWSALLSLINDKRRQAGMDRIGWAHPTLYGSPSSLIDITIGNNAGCPSPQNADGFGEAGGWSPVTGLGTPSHQFAALSSLFGV